MEQELKAISRQLNSISVALKDILGVLLICFFGCAVTFIFSATFSAAKKPQEIVIKSIQLEKDIYGNTVPIAITGGVSVDLGSKPTPIVIENNVSDEWENKGKKIPFIISLNIGKDQKPIPISLGNKETKKPFEDPVRIPLLIKLDKGAEGKK